MKYEIKTGVHEHGTLKTGKRFHIVNNVIGRKKEQKGEPSHE